MYTAQQSSVKTDERDDPVLRKWGSHPLNKNLEKYGSTKGWGSEKLERYAAREHEIETKLRKYAAPVVISHSTVLNKYARPQVTNTEALLRWSSLARPERKSQVQNMVDVILTNKTPQQKTETIIAQTARQQKSQVTGTLLNNLYSSMLTNLKPMLYYLTLSVTLSLAIALFYIYFQAGSWMIFLTILRNLGLKIVPNILISALKRAGFAVTSNMSITALMKLAEKDPRVAKILAKQIKPQFVENCLKRIGVDVKNADLSVRNLSRQAISNGIAIGTQGISGYLLSKGLTKTADITISSIRAGGKSAKAKIQNMVSELGKTPQRVVNKILTTKTKTTDVLQMTQELERTPEIKSFDTPVTEPPPAEAPAVTQMASDIRDMIRENRAAALSTATAISLVSIALTTDLSGVTEVLSDQLTELGSWAPELATKSFDFVKENAIAKYTLFTILADKVGITKLTSALVDVLTPAQIQRLTQLSTTIKSKPQTPVRNGYLTEFYSIVMGDKIYGKRELDTKDVAQLRVIAQKKGIALRGETPSRASLVQTILNDQTARINKISQMVAGSLTNSLKSALAGMVVSQAYENLPYAMAGLDEIQKELGKLYSAAPPESTDIERTAEYQRLQQESELEKSVRRQEARRMVQEARLEQSQREAERLEQHRQTLEARTERRRLQEVAELHDISKKLQIYVNVNGEAHGVPVDDVLLNPQLQEAMQQIEFTPFLEYLTVQTAKSSVSWVPGLGWIQNTIDITNWTVDVAEKVKDVYKVVNVALQLVDEKGESKIAVDEQTVERLDELLKKRLPSLTQVVDQLVQFDKVNLKTITLETLRDKILFGWDNNRAAYELGKKILGKREVEAAEIAVEATSQFFTPAMQFAQSTYDYADSTYREIGMAIWGEAAK